MAAAPMLRSSGVRLPISAKRNPKNEKTTIAIEISEEILPVSAKPKMSAPIRMKTGSGMMPIRHSITLHQPSGQKRAGFSIDSPIGRSVVAAVREDGTVLGEALRQLAGKAPHGGVQLHRRAHLEGKRKAHQLARVPVELVAIALQQRAAHGRLGHAQAVEELAPRAFDVGMEEQLRRHAARNGGEG